MCRLQSWDKPTLDFAGFFFVCLFVKINPFEAHLMVSSRVIDSKVLGMAIQFSIFLIRRQNGECNVRKF